MELLILLTNVPFLLLQFVDSSQFQSSFFFVTNIQTVFYNLYPFLILEGFPIIAQTLAGL